MLAVVLWLWGRGPTGPGWRAWYTAEHVNAAARMISANLTVPHKVVCITDTPEGIECETYPLWHDAPALLTVAGRPNCYKRLRLFEPGFIEHELGADAALSVDIDCIVMGNLDALLTGPYAKVPFAIVRGQHALYNGSMWLVRARAWPSVWLDFNQDQAAAALACKSAKHPTKPGARMIGSDQVWLSMKIRHAAVWGAEHGVLFFSSHAISHASDKRVRVWFFPGSVKPWSKQTKDRLPEAFEVYKLAAKGEARAALPNG